MSWATNDHTFSMPWFVGGGFSSVGMPFRACFTSGASVGKRALELESWPSCGPCHRVQLVLARGVPVWNLSFLRTLAAWTWWHISPSERPHKLLFSAKCDVIQYRGVILGGSFFLAKIWKEDITWMKKQIVEKKFFLFMGYCFLSMGFALLT